MQRQSFAIVCALIVGLAQHAAAAGDIPWQTNLPKASADALSANQPMFIEFWADWCAPCKVMDAEVYTNPAVIAAMARVQPVRIDVDRQDTVAREYSVAGMPTIVFADSHGNELFRFQGTLTVDTAVQLLKELPGDIANINRLAAMLAKDKDSFDALEGLGHQLRGARLYRASNGYVNRAIRLPAAPERASRRGQLLLALGHNHLELKEFADGGRAFQRYLKEFPGTRGESEALLGLARAHLFQNKRGEAKRTLQTLTDRYKSGPVYTQAARLLASL